MSARDPHIPRRGGVRPSHRHRHRQRPSRRCPRSQTATLCAGGAAFCGCTRSLHYPDVASFSAGFRLPGGNSIGDDGHDGFWPPCYDSCRNGQLWGNGQHLTQPHRLAVGGGGCPGPDGQPHQRRGTARPPGRNRRVCVRLRRCDLEGRHAHRGGPRDPGILEGPWKAAVLCDQQLYQVPCGVPGQVHEPGPEDQRQRDLLLVVRRRRLPGLRRLPEGQADLRHRGVGIEQELDLLGFRYLGGPKDAGKVIELKPGFALQHDHDVGAVIVGFDRHFNYYKIQYAQLCINENPGCLFIATNTDAVTHLTDAQEWAGNGSMVGCIKGCTGKEPIVVGKPSGFMMDNIAQTFHIPKQRICMVGDRLDTDILFGQANGTSDMLVLSGVTTEAALLNPKNTVRPTAVANSIADFLRLKK
eukprot:TRINITY_DN3931_c0_g1_i1.p1 TRINITY_DN3931_c0_g1~~TRINITY_DN3931_c0_g1_i1.p1  ORF type:complete len:414 (-),score=42.57 TRINITY_DN3931_c0_g1_i1:121-1362(-)